jgi:2-C-methyl-D-erythritol 4-phosphate cytidylyltransferase/2-C-methyl-D-erythritol 2,4-cyclodiphosphate synthase
VAAGRGTRVAGGGDIPKQYAKVGGIPIILQALTGLLAHPAVTAGVVVIHPDDRDLYAAVVPAPDNRLLAPVAGGATRQASVLAGLRCLAAVRPEFVLIHDAARPFITPDVLGRVMEALAAHDAVIPALPVVDTLKRVGSAGIITGTADRTGLWRAQTPQGFRYVKILAAHEAAAGRADLDFTDDAAIAEWAGLPVAVVHGAERNFKVTTREDMERAAALAVSATEPRTGTGFDVHRFAAGDHVWLCGVKIPHTARLDGHSDADVGLHALTDAILGAIGDGDIGQHFPPTDERWRGAASHIFLADAAARVSARGGRITNVDVALLCEAPRVGPHRDAMRAAVATILGIAIDRVGVKATTTEGLGFTGRREGIAAMASATVLLPNAG